MKRSSILGLYMGNTSLHCVEDWPDGRLGQAVTWGVAALLRPKARPRRCLGGSGATPWCPCPSNYRVDVQPAVLLCELRVGENGPKHAVVHVEIGRHPLAAAQQQFLDVRSKEGRHHLIDGRALSAHLHQLRAIQL